MKKIISLVFLLAALGAQVFAVTAKVTYVKGKVEVSRNDGWVALKAGDELSQNDVISTGFQSEARINFNGSVMAVPALTRITLDTLASSDTKDSVTIYVNTGAVRSKVTHTDGKKVDYKARTAVAVASVRGTMFDVLPRGKFAVLEGAVAVYPAKYYNPDRKTSDARDEADPDEGPADANTPVDEISDSAPSNALVVGAGQETSFGDGRAPSNPFTEAKKSVEKAKNSVSTASDKDAASMGTNTPVAPAAAVQTPTTGSLVVTIELED